VALSNKLDSLAEVEEMARDLCQQLMTAGAAHADLLGVQLNGLRNLAQVIQVGDGRIARTAELEIKQQALAAMNPQPGPCHAEAPMYRFYGANPVPKFCTMMAGHAGAHMNSDDGRMVWEDEAPAEPTKFAADRLHELVSYGTQMEASNRTVEYPCPDAADAYQDMTSKLQEILREGGI
jgi:hypothetical protein